MADILTMLTNDLIGEIAPPGMQWGIFGNGSAVVVADSVVAFDYRREWAISDYPVERGAFESFDKVELPFDARFRFTAGGNIARRSALLNSLEAIAGTTTIYDVVTPEMVYPSVSVSHIDYQRTAMNGVGLLNVYVWCLHIRQTADSTGGSSSGSSSSNPGGSGTSPAWSGGGSPLDVQYGGTVQAVPATTIQTSLVEDSSILSTAYSP